ncbi:PucR family transcriptional regulator [Kocuria nitroreducens]|uniref:PucR family transcriptional regulator n=1 Tax=Kocuria nitroreducens TaxID=3058914 RepID=UPI0036D9603E
MTSQRVSVEDLVSHPQLSMTYLAGRSGGHRAVLWAQSCEQERPWEWIGTGDLLLSAGSSFPRSAQQQVDYIDALARAGVSGIVLGEGMSAPLMAEAADFADDLEFPVVQAGYSVPWVFISRTVADLNRHESGRQLRQIVRMYDLLRGTLGGDVSLEDLVERLERETRSRLISVRRQSGQPVLRDIEEAQHEVLAAVLATIGPSGRMPAYVRLSLAGMKATVLPLSEGSSIILVVVPLTDDITPNFFVLEHAATILAVHVQRQASEAMRARESGQRIAAHLLQGSSDGDVLATAFKAAGLETPPWRLTVWHHPAPVDVVDLQWRLSLRQIPHLVGESGAMTLLITADAHLDDGIFGLADGPGFHAGVSEAFSSHRDAGDALRESQWGLEAAESAGTGVVVYRRAHSPLLPRTVAEGHQLVQQTLGSLLDYDRTHGTSLIGTLMTFFDHNCASKQAAEELNIHRQTLAYRLKRLESISGKSLDDLSDQTELFLAVKALRLLGHPDL